jgi:TonB-linked SusC/RagA family outer membrane protein
MSKGFGNARRMVFAVAALCVSAVASAVAQGTVRGTVTSRTTGQPLGDARVTVVGSTIVTMTSVDGKYTLLNVPQGTVAIRVNRLGFESGKKDVAVSNGAEATADFQMVAAIQNLPDVVITATGEERRVEVGNSIGHIEAAATVKTNPIHNMGDLLVAKAPGLTVLPGNMAGGAHTIRIRGLNSLSRSNAPIFVVDGIRIDAGTGNISTGGTTTSRLNDITPEEIENIEVVRGPSAATLYGTDAANGVIVITTKKGRAGKARWSWSSEGGKIEDKNNYEKTWAIWGRDTSVAPGGTAKRCVNIDLRIGGNCIVDSLTSAHMLREPGLTPIMTGDRQLHTVQVQGGSDVARYFLSGTVEGETGPIKMPYTDQRYLDSINVGLRPEWARPERLDRSSFRANMNAAVSPNLDVSVSSMFLRSEQRLPQVDNNVNSFYYNALTNPGFKHAGLGYTGIGAAPQSHPLNGWAQFTPGDIFQRTAIEGVKRFVGGVTASWRPQTWMQNDANVGLDFASQRNLLLCRLAQCPNFGTQRQGSISDDHNNTRILSATIRSTGTWQAFGSSNFRTTIGGDYINNQVDGSNSSSTQLVPGGQTVNSGAVKNASNTLPSATKTLGYYIQEQWAYRDKLWVTGAVRTDQNTAFGTKYQGVYYPKLQVSWAASDESFFPTIPMLNSLRLRTAFGSSGVQPGSTAALQTLSVSTVSINGADVATLRSNDLGNAKLKPELTTELEAGFDVTGWDRRANLEFTWYKKNTTDALINEALASSAGAAVTSILKNLGEVQNVGFEVMLNLQVLDMENVGWDMTFSGSHNANKVISLGKDANGVKIPTIGTTTRTMEGYPLNSQWLVPFTYSDANGDGIIETSEVTIAVGDTDYVGQPFAPNQLSFITGVDLLKKRLRINAQFDHRGGHVILNNTRGFLCVQTNTCYEKSNPDAPLDQQARTVAANYTAVRTNYGFYEKGDFWRFRELSATFEVPQDIARRFARAENVSLSLGARNLKVWSKYTAEDPEANYSTGDNVSTLLTTGPRRYYTARLNVAF